MKVYNKQGVRIDKAMDTDCRRHLLHRVTRRGLTDALHSTASTLTESVIPRLHDEAGSTSWLYERSSSQLVEPSTSARRALDEQLRECLQYYTIQMTK